MQKIVPHLWFATQAKEAAAWYCSLFSDSQITNVTTLPNTPSGNADVVSFVLAGQEFMAINAGPYFTFNPAISLFVTCESEEEADRLWQALSEGGVVRMEYGAYPWASKYGWCDDRYGLSWQLSVSEHHQFGQKITPSFLFTQDKAGKAKEAIELYTSIFPDAQADLLVPYEAGEGDVEGYLKHARFTLAGQAFIAMDSSAAHKFVFNEALSLVVRCDTQEEIDYYWEKLSAVPEAEQCGWLKDAYGVSWQIVPRAMDTMMRTGTPEQVARLTEAFLPMKKFDVAALERAFKGEG